MQAWLSVVVGLALHVAAATSAAQVDVRDADVDMFPTNTRYDPEIPTPAEFLGHPLGHEPVRHHQLVDYINLVASSSERLTVDVIGYSHERRPILFVVATSQENHVRLDAIREEHIALSEAGTDQPVTDDMPGITWINFGVHGAESSGMDASLPFIYHLAAAEGDDIERVLADTVILVTAIFNPDGHAQRVAWFDAYGGKRRIADPGHIEHRYSWQSTRTNHYWFDLNRQWLLLTQPEPRAWMKKWHEWRPNLTVDYHEMQNETYYFHPGVATRTNPLVPDRAEELMAETVRTSEAFLDGEGRLYFHGEIFDNYYPGKGSTFPLLNGGIGVLYEAAATWGRELETGHGLRTFRENIRKHFRTAVASIESGANLRREYLEYQKAFYTNALNEASRYPTKAWVVSAPGDPARLHFFADLLNRHRIATHRLTRNISVGGKTFASSESLAVPASQPQHRLIRSIFEAVTEFEDATFYDVSTWTLPPAFGLDYAALTGRSANAIGDPFIVEAPVAAVPPESTYGYVFEWGQYFAPRALQRVLESGLLARVGTRPFEAFTSSGARSFHRGSIVVPLDRQEAGRAEIYELMKTIASEDDVSIHALTSGRSASGTAGVEVGGPSFRPLTKPEVLLVVGDDINLYDAGEIWHLADYRMHMPITLRRRDSLVDIDWRRYTHIIFPSGKYEEYEPEFADRLRLWVAEGGTAIGMRNAAPWLRGATLDWIDPDGDEAAAVVTKDTEEESEDEDAAERLAYGDKDDFEAQEVIGGAIFAADLDISHPLGFGYAGRAIYLHKNVEEPLLPTENPFATVIQYTDDPVFSGFVSDENREALAGTPSLIAERSGKGSVILFADNPNFRGYWYGTNKLFLNAVFFSTVFDALDDD